MRSIYRGLITGLLILLGYGGGVLAAQEDEACSAVKVRYLTRQGWQNLPADTLLHLRLRSHTLLEIEFPDGCFHDSLLQYRLAGHDTGWTTLRAGRPAYLTGFSSRRYVLYVRYFLDPDGWSAPKRVLTLEVRIPFRTTGAAQLILVLLILLLFYLYLRYRTRTLRRTNQILREKERIGREVQKQRDQLSAMHKDLTDSIRYARKIQQALLPSDYYFHSHFPEAFILYMPRDIVSGDFYWIHAKDERLFFAVADCTGHGVPGAFMSMIGFEILDKIINDQGLVHPGEILNILNYGISNTFSRGEEDLLLKDGMDISFCTLDREKQVLEFAGAFHTLYLIRENKLLEFKGDRVSVGLGESEGGESFTNHVIPLQEHDKLYLFTDGFPDQFGGPGGKKYMYRRFRHLLLSVHELPMERQKQILYESFVFWKGDYRQVDDILIMGMDPLASSRPII